MTKIKFILAQRRAVNHVDLVTPVASNRARRPAVVVYEFWS